MIRKDCWYNTIQALLQKIHTDHEQLSCSSCKTLSMRVEAERPRERERERERERTSFSSFSFEVKSFEFLLFGTTRKKKKKKKKVGWEGSTSGGQSRGGPRVQDMC